MALAPGDRFGLYEVIALIGVGGMGEVYRARDTRLHRDVALKILPEERRLDPESLQRFEREARLLASLNHPNIATLHGIESAAGAHALVMELVEGDGLDERLARVPRNTAGLPPREALQIARQIVDALDAAHERGVVHRDLKPANIKIRPDGTVKVLDFGIAKVFEPGVSGHRGTTVGVTQMPGAVIGTPSYMSPEQARGGGVDRRTDIWALGCVLYEMLAGQRAFDGSTAAEVVARVIEREPDWSKLPAGLPAEVRVLLELCLAKDPKKRRRDVGDVRLDLERALTQPAAAPTAADSRALRRARLWMTAAAALALATIGLLAMRLHSATAPTAASEHVRFAVLAPENGHFTTSLGAGSGAPVGGSISPDGRTLAFTARGASGVIMLWLRPLDTLDAHALPGTEDAALPFWSPDGKGIAFFTSDKLKRIDIGGGPPEVLCGVGRGQGGTWNRNGVIVFSPNLRSGLSRVGAAGGEPVDFGTLGDGDRAYRFPYFLPDGEHLLYYSEGTRPENSGVFVRTLGGDTGRRLLAADSAAIYARSGHLLFVRDGTLFAQRFDAARLILIGEPARVAQSVPTEGSAPAFSASGTGVLTYRSGPADSDAQQFAWFDRTGKLLGVIGPPGTYRGMDLSPDGTRIAAHDHRGNGGDIWVIEPRGAATRVTFDSAQDNQSPIWSPDGRRLAFGSLRNGRWGLYQKSSGGDGDDELIMESDYPTIPSAWSPDGKYLVHYVYAPNALHQWVLPLPPADAKPFRLTNGRSREIQPQISADGRWIAYVSGQTGRGEIFVQPFPSGQSFQQVSTSGGVAPRWRQDGKELFYMTSYDRAKLMAVSIETAGDTIVPGASQELFGVELAIVPHSTAVQNFHTYDVSPDGQRFVIPLPVATLPGESASTAITVLLDWTAALHE